LRPRGQRDRKNANTANTGNAANGAFGIKPKTRYNEHAVNAKLTAPPRFAPGQEPVPARFQALRQVFFQLFSVIST
jgi:hypothetical protein